MRRTFLADIPHRLEGSMYIIVETVQSKDRSGSPNGKTYRRMVIMNGGRTNTVVNPKAARDFRDALGDRFRDDFLAKLQEVAGSED